MIRVVQRWHGLMTSVVQDGIPSAVMWKVVSGSDLSCCRVHDVITAPQFMLFTVGLRSAFHVVRAGISFSQFMLCTIAAWSICSYCTCCARWYHSPMVHAEQDVTMAMHVIIIIIAFGSCWCIARLQELSRHPDPGPASQAALRMGSGVTHPLCFGPQVAASGVPWAASLSLCLWVPGQGLVCGAGHWLLICNLCLSFGVCCSLVGFLTSQQHASVSQERIFTVLRAATLRWKLQIKLSTSPSHSILRPGRPVPALTL